VKITKAELKKIIKEELEVVLTNEEVEEMFGEDVREELEQTQEGFFAGEFDKKSPKKPKTNRPMDKSQKEKDNLDRFYQAVNKRMQKKKLTEPKKEEKSKLVSTSALKEAMTPNDQYQMQMKLNSALREFVQEYIERSELGQGPEGLSEKDIERIRSHINYLVEQVLGFGKKL